MRIERARIGFRKNMLVSDEQLEDEQSDHFHRHRTRKIVDRGCPETDITHEWHKGERGGGGEINDQAPRRQSPGREI